jgi:hypothetical protein
VIDLVDSSYCQESALFHLTGVNTRTLCNHTGFNKRTKRDSIQLASLLCTGPIRFISFASSDNRQKRVTSHSDHQLANTAP